LLHARKISLNRAGKPGLSAAGADFCRPSDIYAVAIVRGGAARRSNRCAVARVVLIPDPPAGSLCDLPEILANLEGSGSRAQFIKIEVTLQLGDVAGRTWCRDSLAPVVQVVAGFFKGRRAEDLRGSAALIRLRGELLARIAAVVGPGVVRDVLFRNVLVQ